MDDRFLAQSESEESRIGLLVERICATLLVPLLGALLYGLVRGVAPHAVLFEIVSAVILVGCWLLVHRGRKRQAAIILSAFAWLGVNSALLLFADLSPLLFTSSGAISLLVAGALLGHRAVPIFAAITALGAVLLELAAQLGALTLEKTISNSWLSAGSNFALIAFLIYYAFRLRQTALEEAERRSAEAETLRQASAAVTASLQLDETIDRILEQLERVVPFDSASVQLLQDNTLEIVGGRGWEDPAQVVGLRFPVGGDNLNTVVVETQETLILADAPAVHGPFRRPPHDHIRSWLGVPLLVGGDLVGMLTIDHTEPGRYGDHEARVARAFANEVAVALENARHFRAEQRRRQLAAMQQDITQVTSSSLNLDDVLTRIALLTTEATKADRAFVLLFEDESETLSLHSFEDSTGPVSEDQARALEEALASFAAQSELGPVLHDRRLLLLERSALAAKLPADLVQQLPTEALLLAPLVAVGGTRGLLGVERTTAGEGFPDDARETLQIIAQSVASGIENARLYARLEEMAITDRLTGAYNRHGLEQLAARELDRAARYERPLCLIMLDLDRFKRLNDEHGHPVGDEVLAGLAACVLSSLRRVDLLSRYGGEEFLALLPECAASDGARVAERVRRTIETTRFATATGPLKITVSIGVASTEQIPLDLEALINAADQALYAAKKAGRNRVFLWREEGPVAAPS